MQPLRKKKLAHMEHISGKGRMTVFAAGTRARTRYVQEGDVAYILQSNPHYIENTGDIGRAMIDARYKHAGSHSMVRPDVSMTWSPCRPGVRFPIGSHISDI